jgi:putative SOS response-associated peptidase YedK
MPVWFALSEERPLFTFAGSGTRWTGTRGPKSNPVEGDHELYGFLTCDPNETVGALPKAMPVLLTTPDEMATWMETPREIARNSSNRCLMTKMLVVSKVHQKDPE